MLKLIFQPIDLVQDIKTITLSILQPTPNPFRLKPELQDNHTLVIGYANGKFARVILSSPII